MSTSRWISILALLGTIGGAAATLGHLIPGETGIIITAVGAALLAFNERVQGGASKREG